MGEQFLHDNFRRTEADKLPKVVSLLKAVVELLLWWPTWPSLFFSGDERMANKIRSWRLNTGKVQLR